MKEKAFEKVTEYIDSIAAKMGVAAEHVYGILIRQQIAEGVADIITAVLILIVGYIVCKYFTKLTRGKAARAKEKWITDIDDDIVVFLRYAVWVVYFVLAIIAVCTVPGAITKLINPEYYAIKEILDALGGK